MVKVMMGLGAAFLYGSLGAAMGIAEPQVNAPPAALTVIELYGNHASEGIQAASAGSGRRPVAPGEMSEEEMERRREVCAREYTFCYDWCSESRRTKDAQRRCYIECSKKNTECMEKIR